MKCNYKRKLNNYIPREAIQTVDGMLKNVPISEKDYIERTFKEYDIEVVTPKKKFINAMKQGDYIIGVDYNPFLFQNVFHYENSVLEFFRFADVGNHLLAPLKLKREQTIFLGARSSSMFEVFFDTLPHYDEFIVCHKGNLIDIENIPPSIVSFMKR